MTGSRDPIFETGDLPGVDTEAVFAPDFNYTPTEKSVFAHLLSVKVTAGDLVEEFLTRDEGTGYSEVPAPLGGAH